ncbi:MAG: hypothetical protein F6J87_10875 [Spirulina sp. SIO3F2]|nr:hypothetical protein [Spirulina sp. SIO3F2]
MKKINTIATIFLSLIPLGLTPTPAPAQDRFDSQVIRFDEDTIVEFEVATSQGANRAEFGVIANPDTTAVKTPLFIERKPYDDFGLPGLTQYMGTVNGGTLQGVSGNGAQVVAVRDRAAQGQGTVIVEYLFKANVPHVFYMDIYTPAEERYITTLTSVNVQNTRFAGALDDGQGLAIAWEDQGEGRVTAGELETEPSDGDFNDMVVFAGGQLPCYSRFAEPGDRPGTLEARRQ